MNQILLGVAAILVAYLLGSFPTAYIIGKWRKGVDIREVGVGNMGAANVFREIGSWEGILCWAGDVAKGSAAIIVAQALGVSLPWIFATGVAALLGHSFPVYIGFRGGKGASTTMGIFLVLAPVPMAVTFAALAIPYIFVRRIFVAMCIVAPLLPILIWFLEHSQMLTLYSVALLLFMGLRNLPPLGQLRQMLAGMRKK
jgi:glycerol-3-phosphate acyltransferase PlsY